MDDYKVYEEIIIPTKIVDYIIKNVNSQAFLKWKELGCQIQPRAEAKSIFIILNGSEEENDDCFDKIFKSLKYAEDVQQLKFKIMTRMLIPNQKCGYVVGRNGTTLKKIENEFNITTLMDPGYTEQIPEGYGRLIIKGTKLEGIKSARFQINYIINIALDLNPYGPADGKKILALGRKTHAEEKIKVPLFSSFNDEQKELFREIQKTSNVDFIVDKENKPPNCRYLLLKGQLNYVIEAKKKISKLIIGLRHSPPIEEDKSPIKNTSSFLNSIDKDEQNIINNGLPYVDVLVPHPNFMFVLGPKGDKIKSLKTELDVNLTFLGDNKAQYLNGRVLRISGKNEKKVLNAKIFIEKEFIENSSMSSISLSPPKKNLININNDENFDRRRRIDNYGNDWGLIEDEKIEVLIPQEIAKIMIKIKIKFNLISYQLRRPNSDGFQMVILKGTNESLEEAKKELELLTNEYIKKKNAEERNEEIFWRKINKIDEVEEEEVKEDDDDEEDEVEDVINEEEEEMVEEEEEEEVDEEMKKIEEMMKKNEEMIKNEEKKKNEEKRKSEEMMMNNKEKKNNEEEDEFKSVEVNKIEDDDDEFEWRSNIINNNSEEEDNENKSEEDDDDTLNGDFNEETQKELNELIYSTFQTSLNKREVEDKKVEDKMKSDEEMKEEEELKMEDDEESRMNKKEEDEEKNEDDEGWKEEEDEEEKNEENEEKIEKKNEEEEKEKNLIINEEIKMKINEVEEDIEENEETTNILANPKNFIEKYKNGLNLINEEFFKELIKREEAKNLEIKSIKLENVLLRQKIVELENALSTAASASCLQ